MTYQLSPPPTRPARRDLVLLTARRWLLPGLVAGAAFLAVAMIVGAFVTTAWAMPDAIAAVLGLGTHRYGFQLTPVLVGVAAHLALSTILGVFYTAIARRLRLRRVGLVIGAVLFSGLETPISIWVVLHSVLPPSTFHFFLQALPFWGSFLGRNTYGLVLGLLSAWLARYERADRDRAGTVPAGAG